MPQGCVDVGHEMTQGIPNGKTLRGSFDQFNDRATAQVLSALATDSALVLAHVYIADKSSEIPAVRALLAELGLSRHL